MSEDLAARYETDPVFRAACEVVSRGGWVDEDGCQHYGISIGEADRASRILAAVQPLIEAPLRAVLLQIDMETERHHFGDPGYDITLDHIHELIESVLNPEKVA